MRDRLLGYLLDALDANEQAGVEQALEHDPALRQDLQLLATSFHPLAGDDEFDPPAGLADRTCAAIFAYHEMVSRFPVAAADDR